PRGPEPDSRRWDRARSGIAMGPRAQFRHNLTGEIGTRRTVRPGPVPGNPRVAGVMRIMSGRPVNDVRARPDSRSRMSRGGEAMIVAGDIGGTKTVLALFEPNGDGLRLVREQIYASREYSTFDQILAEFLAGQGGPRPSAGCFGVAGLVAGG